MAVQNLSPWMLLPMVRVCLSISVNLIQEVPLTLAQKFVSIKLTFKMDHGTAMQGFIHLHPWCSGEAGRAGCFTGEFKGQWDRGVELFNKGPLLVPDAVWPLCH